MLDINIIAIGKINDSSTKFLTDEYFKRLKPYAKIKITELKEESFSDSNAKQAKDAEAVKIIKTISKNTNSFIICLDENGDHFTSTEFANFLENINGPIAMIIGGSLGLSSSVLDKSQKSISLSKMTFTHEMARLFLLEQIYRATTIINNKKYHH